MSWLQKGKNLHTNRFLEIDDLNLTNSIIQKLSNSIISIKWIQGFCSVESYDKIETLIKIFLENDNWICEKCENIICSKSVMCDKCLAWYDVSCVNYDNSHQDEFICLKC